MSRLLSRLLDRWISHDFVGTAAGVIGIASGLNSLFGGGGGAPQPQNYSYYNPVQQGQVAGSWMDSFNQAKGLESGLSGAVSPALLQAIDGGLATPTGSLSALPPQLQQAYGQMGSADQLYAALLGRTGANTLATLPQAGMSTYLNALDPQQALHDRLLHNVLDQSGAGQAQRGIQIGGQGQALSDEAGTNFELNWANQLLGRQVQGLTALEQATNVGSQAGTNTLNASSNMFGQVPGALTGGATAPQAPASLESQFLSTILQQLGGAYQNFGVAPLQQVQNQAIPFLNQGAGAGANAFSGALTGYGINNLNSAYGTQALLQGAKGLQTTGLGQWLNSMGGSTPTGNNPNAYGDMAAQAPPVAGNWAYP
jgi:hypothetical protein